MRQDYSKQWFLQFINIPYKLYDCVDFTIHIQEKVFNRKINKPSINKKSLFTVNESFNKHVFNYLEKTNFPNDGDAVLVKCKNRIGHIGVYFKYSGQEYIIHTLDSFGKSIIHKINDLERISMKFEGYYSWK